MKSARSPAVDAASGRRLQPARQARTNPHRATGLQRTGSGRGSIGGPAPDQPIDIFPGVEHFADAITALPKELVRHFTLLKEVDAKSSAPEQHLQDLVQACLDSPFPRPKAHADAASPSSTGGAVTPRSAVVGAQNNASTVALNNPIRPATVTDEAYRAAVYSQSNMPRRQLFLGAAARIKDMLMSLDERNHVICTANEALQRQLSRVEDVWPHLEAEFSEEAKWGSNTHWAYPENRLGKTAQNERPRRDGQSTAAQQAAEEAAARSDARKQAVQAKKNQRNQAQDGDDGDGRQKTEGGKRAQGTKSRKTAEGPGAVGLGITAGSSTNGAAPNPPSKRRKVEKPVNGGGPPAERAMSTVFGNVSKAKSTTSPRATPAPDGQKKRKALPSGPTQVKKSRNGTTAPVSAAASPILSANPDPSTSARASPVPPLSSTPRPTSARSKPNTSQPVSEPSSNANGADNGGNTSNGKAKQVSSAPEKPNSTAPGTPDITPPDNWPQQALDEPKPVAQQPEPAAQETTSPETATKELDTKEVEPTVPSVSKKETPKPEPSEKKIEPLRPVPAPITAPPATVPLPAAPAAAAPPTVTTKSGRASKPSTPALATFQEAATARSRSSRTAADPSSKRGHKKSASQSVSSAAAPAAPAPSSVPTANNGNGTRARIHEEEEEGEVEIDADEPTYCYCNSVSYGAMVACDADECTREWFHLECVGLKVPPKTNVKWFCEDCKKRMKIGEKKGGGGR